MGKMKRPAAEGYDGVLRYGKVDHFGARWGCIKETLQWTSGVVEKQLTAKLPPYSYPMMVAVKCQEAGTIDTGDYLAFGTTADPDEYFNVVFTSYDAVGDSLVQIPTAQVISSSELTLQLAASNSSGAETGTITDGTWDVAIWFIQYDEFETTS